MASVSESITVDVPVATAYNQWTQFETFPAFMDGVDKVTQIDDTHTRWVTSVGGVRSDFDAEITQQRPDECVAWASTDGVAHSGVITFQALGDQITRIHADIVWNPQSVTEKVGAAAGLDDFRVRGDLHRFKEFIEERYEHTRGTEQSAETGAWRGQVGDGTRP